MQLALGVYRQNDSSSSLHVELRVAPLHWIGLELSDKSGREGQAVRVVSARAEVASHFNFRALDWIGLSSLCITTNRRGADGAS